MRAVTADRLGTDAFGSSMGRGPDWATDDEPVIWVAVATKHGTDDSVKTPEVPLARLADVSPRSVDVTVSLEGDAFSRSVPVFAEHESIGLP